MARVSRIAKPTYSIPWRALSPRRATVSSAGAETGWEERTKIAAAYAIAAPQRIAALRLRIRALGRLRLLLFLGFLRLTRSGGGLLEDGPALRTLRRVGGDVRPAVRAHEAGGRLRLCRHPETLALPPGAGRPPEEHQQDEVQGEGKDQREDSVVERKPIERPVARGDRADLPRGLEPFVRGSVLDGDEEPEEIDAVVDGDCPAVQLPVREVRVVHVRGGHVQRVRGAVHRGQVHVHGVVRGVRDARDREVRGERVQGARGPAARGHRAVP